MGAFRLLRGRPSAVDPDAPPFFAYNSGGFTVTGATSSRNVTTTVDAPSGSTLVLFHTAGNGNYLTGVTGGSGTWVIGNKASGSLDSRSASIKLTAALPAGSTIGFTQQAAGGCSIMIFCWTGGIALDQTAPTVVTSYPASIADSNLPCYCAALMTTGTGISGTLPSGWSMGDVHYGSNTQFGVKMVYRRIESGQSPASLASDMGSGQALVYVTFTAPVKGSNTNIVASGPTELAAKVGVCSGGETILIKAGVTITGTSISSKSFASHITIRSESTSNKGYLVNTILTDVSGIDLTDLNIGSTSSGTGLGVLGTSSNCTLTSLNFDSTCGTAFVCRGTSITIQDSVFTDAGRGCQMDNSTTCTIQRNKFNRFTEDAVHLSGVSGITVSRNYFVNPHQIDLTGNTHMDCIQCTQDGGAGTSSSNITITENLYYIGTGDAAQFIFLGDQTMNTVTVQRNMAVGPENYGGAVSTATNVTWDGNKSYQLSRNVAPGTSNIYANYNPYYSSCTTISLTNNVGSVVANGAMPSTGVTTSGNTAAPNVDSDDGAAVIAAFRALYTDIPA
jgi:hypothetical protein